MILELDIGNTRVKWRFTDSLRTVHSQGVAKGVRELAAEPQLKTDLHLVRASCVRKGELAIELQNWVRATFGLDVVFAQVLSKCGDVSNQYQDPSRLGVDRWLAMLAAFNMEKNQCIVVDGGTALTVDVLSSAGVHQGGYILPGINLMLNSLEQNTAIRLSNVENLPALELGHSTDDAVKNGVLASGVALIEKVAIQTKGNSPRIPLFVAGGDGSRLVSAFNESPKFDNIEVQLMPDLVLDGLAIACPDPASVLSQ